MLKLKRIKGTEIEAGTRFSNDYFYAHCQASGGKTVYVGIRIYSDCVSVTLTVRKNYKSILESVSTGASIKQACSDVFCMDIKEDTAMKAIVQLFDRIAYRGYVIFHNTGYARFNPVSKERISIESI